MQSAPSYLDTFVFDQDEQMGQLFRFTHVIIEIMGGAWDGWRLDSRSSNPIERELVRHFYGAKTYEIVDHVDDECGEWLQLRYKG